MGYMLHDSMAAIPTGIPDSSIPTVTPVACRCLGEADSSIPVATLPPSEPGVPLPSDTAAARIR